MIFDDRLCTKLLNECCVDKTDCDENCNILTLKYLCCDNIKGFKGYAKPSLVDAIRISSKKENYFVLVEIKNSPIAKNIKKEEIEKQLTSTVDYLEDNYIETLSNGIKFFISISPTKNTTSLKKLEDLIFQAKLGLFFNTIYKYKSKKRPTTYSIKSNIVFCDETDKKCN